MARKSKVKGQTPAEVSPQGEKRLQCRAVEVQTIDPVTRDAALEWCRKAECDRLAWAEHPAEGDKPVHYHVVARWSRTVDCISLRQLVNRMDSHSHCDRVNRWPNMVRYLRHLDQPEKAVIPPEAAHYEGFPEVEVEAATKENGTAVALIEMIAELPHGTNPVEALKVCVHAGFRPSEVSGVTRALYDLRNLLADSRQVGIDRRDDVSRPGEAPCGPSSVPSVVFVPAPDDPAFFAPRSEWPDYSPDAE